MPTIKLQPNEWTPILVRIEQEYGRAARYISFVMKRELGFQMRHYSYWQESTRQTMTEIHLDFDDETAATFFRIKFL